MRDSVEKKEMAGRRGVLDEVEARLDARAGTQVHLQALDGVMSVNAYFTVAVFIGMAYTNGAARGSGLVAECSAGADTPKRLLVLEVVSFACYLFSSLVAQSLKLLFVLLHSRVEQQQELTGQGRPRLLHLGMLATALGTIAGTFFLMLSIVNLVELRLGLMSCGSGWAAAAILPLVIMVSVGLLIFISTAVYSFLC